VELIHIKSLLNLLGAIVITDFICAFLPCYIFYNSTLVRRDKITLSILMSLGLVSALTCAPKFQASRYWLVKDFTHNTAFFAFWSVIEIHLAIIALSIPALKVVFEGILRYCGLMNRITAQETWAWDFEPHDKLDRTTSIVASSSSSPNEDTECERPIPWTELEELSQSKSRQGSKVQSFDMLNSHIEEP
jgi:hypothetical protein